MLCYHENVLCYQVCYWMCHCVLRGRFIRRVERRVCAMLCYHEKVRRALPNCFAAKVMSKPPTSPPGITCASVRNVVVG